MRTVGFEFDIGKYVQSDRENNELSIFIYKRSEVNGIKKYYVDISLEYQRVYRIVETVPVFQGEIQVQGSKIEMKERRCVNYNYIMDAATFKNILMYDLSEIIRDSSNIAYHLLGRCDKVVIVDKTAVRISNAKINELIGSKGVRGVDRYVERCIDRSIKRGEADKVNVLKNCWEERLTKGMKDYRLKY